MLNCTTGLLPCVFEGRNCTQFPYITSHVVGVVANCAMGLFREIIASLINEFGPVSMRNSAVVGVVANCTMGLFGDVITSLLNEFGPSFTTQLRSCRCRGELHYGTVWRRHYLFAK